MAYVEDHGPSKRVVWYIPNTKPRRRERSHPYDDLPVALLAKEIVEHYDGAINKDELDELVARTANRKPTASSERPEVKAGAPTFREWVEAWLDSRLDISKGTLRGYRYLLMDKPVAMFGSVRLPLIDHEMILRLFVQYARSQPRNRPGATIKPHSVVRLHTALRACLESAVPRWIQVNPCVPPGGKKKRIALPKPRRYDPVFLTPEEARLIVERAAPDVRDLIDTLFHTGMRTFVEAASLTCGDVDRRQPVLYVRESKTDAGVRAVGIPERLWAILLGRTQNRLSTDLLFPSPQGKRWGASHFRNYRWKPAVAAAMRCPDHMPPLRIYKRGAPRLDPLSVSTCTCPPPARLHERPKPYDARHTHIAWCVDTGMDFDEIRQRVGHEHVETTIDVYARRRRTEKPGAVEAIDSMAANNDVRLVA